MNVIVWSSPVPMAHPPRSKPFLRSSSVVPPLPCITPSTVTCVTVVSLMIVVPHSLRLSPGGGPRELPLIRTTKSDGPLRHSHPIVRRDAVGSATRGSSSAGRAAAFQAACRGFDPRLPLHPSTLPGRERVQCD